MLRDVCTSAGSVMVDGFAVLLVAEGPHGRCIRLSPDGTSMSVPVVVDSEASALKACKALAMPV